MPAIKKVSPSPKRFTFPPQEELERVVKRARRSDRWTNIGLLLMPLNPVKLSTIYVCIV